MPLTLDGNIQGTLSSVSTLRGTVADTQSVTGALTTASGQGGGGIPRGGAIGDLLSKHSDEDFDTEWVTPADRAESDNTRPITAAAVYTEIGNINALLATI